MPNSGGLAGGKLLKSGYMMPPLIANFMWEQDGVAHQEIRFYPFIPKKNLKKRTLSEAARRANYRMFNYVRLDTLLYFVLHQE